MELEKRHEAFTSNSQPPVLYVTYICVCVCVCLSNTSKVKPLELVPRFFFLVLSCVLLLFFGCPVESPFKNTYTHVPPEALKTALLLLMVFLRCDKGKSAPEGS